MNQKEILLKSLKEKGFSKQILKAFEKVKREDFIPEILKDRAYEDTALSLGFGQTISQPYTIATMLSLLELKPSLRVLEVGSGCGYVLALLSEILGSKGKVFGIEIIKELGEKSKENLENYENIKVYNKNGRLGLKTKAPFDRIIISAAYNEIPKPLIEQLKENGIIVAPVGSHYSQSLIAYKKVMGKIGIEKEIPGFIFVPLVDN